MSGATVDAGTLTHPPRRAGFPLSRLRERRAERSEAGEGASRVLALCARSC